MDFIKEIKKKFKDNIVNFEKKTERRYYIEIPAEYLRTAARYLFDEAGCRFSTVSGIDEKDIMELIYHFSYDKEGAFISLKIKTDRKRPVVDTLTDIIKGTKWIERELRELLGVRFEGNEDTENLLLSESYRGKRYPLRKNG